MSLVLWAVISVFVLLSTDILSLSLKRRGWQRFTSTFFLFYAQIILSEFILGLLSWLTSLNLIIFNILLSLAILIFSRMVYKNSVFRDYLSANKKLPQKLWENVRNDRPFLVLLVIFIALLLWILFLGTIFPVTDFDGNSYHLTFIGYSMQNHNIFDVQTSLQWLKGYPKGGELIEMWNIIIAKNDMFVDLVQVPFMFLGVFSLYKICTALGVKKRDARFVSLLFIFIPIVLNQLKTTYVDVMLCSLFLASLAVVVKEKLSKLDLVILGIIYSLLLSVKFTGFIFILASIPFLVKFLYESNGRKIHDGLSNYAIQLSLVFSPIIFGVYWYVKNYILYGSPLYPFGLKLSGFTIFPGKTFQEFAASAVSSISALPHGYFQKIWFVWTEQKAWYGCLYNYDTNFAGLGPIWFIVLLPAIIVSIYFAIKKKNFLYMGLTSVVILTYLIYPTNYYPRYTMFISALGIYSLGLVFIYLDQRVRNFVKIVVILLAIFVVETNFTLCNFSPNIVIDQIGSLRTGNSRGVAFTNTIGYAYVYLENTIKPNETVAYDSSPYFIYPLWKPNFSDKVIYVPAANQEQWYKGLKEKNVKYIFIDIGSKQYKWLEPTNKFTIIYKDNQYEIYRVY